MWALITEIIILVVSKPIYICLVLLVVERQSICWFFSPLLLNGPRRCQTPGWKNTQFLICVKWSGCLASENETSGARSNVFTFQQYFGIMWKLLLSKTRNKEFTQEVGPPKSNPGKLSCPYSSSFIHLKSFKRTEHMTRAEHCVIEM